jgi:hypothetical protein
MPPLPVDYSEYCNKAGGSPIEHCMDSLSAARNNKQNTGLTLIMMTSKPWGMTY